MTSLYDVYLVASAGLPRDHHSIFVQTESDGSGHTFQVTGNIQEGMKHEEKLKDRPEDSPAYIGRELVGNVAKDDLDRVRDTCWAISAPEKQFDGPKRLWPQKPLRRCQEWTCEAMSALVDAGILKKQ